MPKKIRYRKVHRGRRKGAAKGASKVTIGDFGLQAQEPGWITSRQIEAIRVTINRKLKKVGKLHLRMFPDKSVTKKPAETRMGKGKGSPEFWVFVAKRGRILVEVSGIDRATAKKILHVASCKLPIRTRVVGREDAIGTKQANAEGEHA